MIGRDKAMVWSSVPKEIKRRLEALRKLDPIALSESRVIWQALESYLPIVEAQIQRHGKPPRRTT